MSSYNVDPIYLSLYVGNEPLNVLNLDAYCSHLLQVRWKALQVLHIYICVSYCKYFVHFGKQHMFCIVIKACTNTFVPAFSLIVDTGFELLLVRLSVLRMLFILLIFSYTQNFCRSGPIRVQSPELQLYN